LGEQLFFTRLGTLLAWLAFVVGALRFGSAFYVGSIEEPVMRAALAARYGVSSPGAAINQASIVIAVAIGLGILAEISKAIHKNLAIEDREV
jgi:hypothetical protein